MLNTLKKGIDNVRNSKFVESVVPVIASVAVIIVVCAAINVGTRELDNAVTSLLHPVVDESSEE